MHSLPVSNLPLTWAQAEKRISSTENSRLNHEVRGRRLVPARISVVDSVENCLSPESCCDPLADELDLASATANAERIESVLKVNPLAQNSYQNEKRIGAFVGLLKAANTSEIHVFTDRQHSKIAAAGNVVMDRGAECAAGGYDAV